MAGISCLTTLESRGFLAHERAWGEDAKPNVSRFASSPHARSWARKPLWRRLGTKILTSLRRDHMTGKIFGESPRGWRFQSKPRKCWSWQNVAVWIELEGLYKSTGRRKLYVVICSRVLFVYLRKIKKIALETSGWFQRLVTSSRMKSLSRRYSSDWADSFCCYLWSQTAFDFTYTGKLCLTVSSAITQHIRRCVCSLTVCICVCSLDLTACRVCLWSKN